jgi:ribosomal protein S6
LKRYEVMFLFDTAAVRDWAGIEEEVRRLCERIGAQLLVCVKFDERKLAFEIARRKRGTYVLTYIDAPVERIGDLERDVRLSEVILRALVLRADKLTEAKLAELRAHPAETPLAPMTGDGRRHEDDRRPHDRRPPYRDSAPMAGPGPSVAETEMPAAAPSVEAD